MAVSSIFSGLMEEIQGSWWNDPHLVELISKLQNHNPLKSPYAWKDEQLTRRGRLVVESDVTL